MATENAMTNKEPSFGMEKSSGLRFLYENYKARSWYWEMIKMSRKVVLTSGLALVGQESRSYIGHWSFGQSREVRITFCLCPPHTRRVRESIDLFI